MPGEPLLYTPAPPEQGGFNCAYCWWKTTPVSAALFAKALSKPAMRSIGSASVHVALKGPFPASTIFSSSMSFCPTSMGWSCSPRPGQRVTCPVLLLTALDAVEDRVRGLDSGADDYLVKPFAFPELLARIRALLRRPQSDVQPTLQVGSIEMDVLRREVRVGDRPVSLSRREFALLEYMMRHPGEVLTRTQIAERVWGFDFYNETNVVDVYVGYLRRKLGHGQGSSVIRTLRGTGFVLEEDGGSSSD